MVCLSTVFLTFPLAATLQKSFFIGHKSYGVFINSILDFSSCCDPPEEFLYRTQELWCVYQQYS